MKKLAGIISPISTPFIDDDIAFDKLKFNIEKWNEAALSGYVVMGSNGESVFLTRDEKLKLVERSREFASREKLIIVGSGSDSIRETISLTNKCAELGADFALILTPSFYKSEMRCSALIKYFEAVADAAKIPILIYNVPKFTNIDIGLDAVVNLSKHPNIAGIKNSTENIRQVIEFIKNTNEEFKVFIGTASILYSGLTAGAAGGIVALANIAPKSCLAIHKLVHEGKLNEALDLQNQLIPINTAITSRYGIAGMKAAMDMMGYFGGSPRSPLFTLNENDRKEIKKILTTANLL